MCISVCDVDAFMSHTLCNCQCGETHIDQEGYMAVSEIVDPNDLDTTFFAAFFHSSLHGVFEQGEDSAVMLGTMQR